MREHLGSKSHQDVVDIKHDSGGIVDIEFLMQYAVLRYAASHPDLIKWTDNIRISEQLEEEGLLDEVHAKDLREVYQQLRLIVHKQALQNQKPLIPAANIVGYTDSVEHLWAQWMNP